MKSRLQLNALLLYRDFLKFSKTLSASARPTYLAKVKAQFEEDRQIPKRKFNTIEYKIRTGKNLLNSMKESNTTNATTIHITRK